MENSITLQLGPRLDRFCMCFVRSSSMVYHDVRLFYLCRSNKDPTIV